jgi:uncharacterized protein YfaA (DUF2138 family)
MTEDADRIIAALDAHHARAARRQRFWELTRICAHIVIAATLVWLAYHHIGNQVEQVASRLDMRAVETQHDIDALSRSIGDAWRRIDTISGASQKQP